MTDEAPQTENEAAGGQSRAGEAGANLTAVLERKPLGLAEFIERVGGVWLKPYQREMVAEIERGERLMPDPVTMRDPYREWKKRHSEYVAALMRSNAELTGARSASERGTSDVE